MTNLQLIEDLCDIIARQQEIIRALATDLQAAQFLNDADAMMVEEIEEKVNSVIGEL